MSWVCIAATHTAASEYNIATDSARSISKTEQLQSCGNGNFTDQVKSWSDSAQVTITDYDIAEIHESSISFFSFYKVGYFICGEQCKKGRSFYCWGRFLWVGAEILSFYFLVIDNDTNEFDKSSHNTVEIHMLHYNDTFKCLQRSIRISMWAAKNVWLSGLYAMTIQYAPSAPVNMSAYADI